MELPEQLVSIVDYLMEFFQAIDSGAVLSIEIVQAFNHLELSGPLTLGTANYLGLSAQQD